MLHSSLLPDKNYLPFNRQWCVFMDDNNLKTLTFPQTEHTKGSTLAASSVTTD